jgi:hypothetical protein
MQDERHILLPARSFLDLLDLFFTFFLPRLVMQVTVSVRSATTAEAHNKHNHNKGNEAYSDEPKVNVQHCWDTNVLGRVKEKEKKVCQPEPVLVPRFVMSFSLY